MGEALSARKFAELVERSNVWVSRMVKEGRLPTDAAGRIPREEGLKAFKAAQTVGFDKNRENAQLQREKSKKERAPAAKKGAKPAAASKPAKSKPARVVAPPPAQQQIDLPEDDDDLLLAMNEGRLSVAQANEAYNRWRAKEKHLQVLQREVELRRTQGDLLAVAEVEADAQAVAGELMDKLRSLPPRIAPLCEGRPAREIEGVIDAEINEVLAALQKSRFARGATGG